MATYYVNKSGNNGNAGTSVGAAKLTIQAAMTLTSTGDTVVVGSGLYNESVTWVSGTRTMLADGNVVMDGTGLAVNPAIYTTGSASVALNLQPQTTGGTWLLQNYITSGTLIPNLYGTANAIIRLDVSNTSVTSAVTINNVVFIATGTQWAVSNSVYGTNPVIIANNCVFSNFYYALVSWFNNIGTVNHIIQNNTFYNCIVGIYFYYGTSPSGVIRNNIFSNCTNPIYLYGIPLSCDNNIYYNYSTVSSSSSSSNSLGSAGSTKTFTIGTGLTLPLGQFIVMMNDATHYMLGYVTAYNSGAGSMTMTSISVTGSGTFASWTLATANWVKDVTTTSSTYYSTFAAWQAALFDVSSLNQNPNFIDPTNNIFFLTSNPYGGSIYNFYYGAYNFGKTTGSAYAGTDTTWKIITSLDSPAQSGTGWLNTDTFVTQNGTTKDFELTSDTVGVITSPVYDVGSVQTSTATGLAGIQVWPTNMFDTTISDVQPNYQTMEIRASNSAYNQGDASPSWTEIKWGLPMSSMTGRYWQLRVTLRNNDVAA